MIKQKYLQYFTNFFVVFSLVIFLNLFIVGTVSSNEGPATSGASFKNPIEHGTVDKLLQSVGGAVKNVVATLAVLMIIVGGIFYITSAGDQGRVELAKKTITAALIGLALVLAAPAFLHEIYTVLGAGDSGVAYSKSLSEIIIEAIKVLSGFVGALAVLMLLVGGFMYMTSGGDSTRADTAKNVIKYAIIGLIVSIMSLIIVVQVTKLF